MKLLRHLEALLLLMSCLALTASAGFLFKEIGGALSAVTLIVAVIWGFTLWMRMKNPLYDELNESTTLWLQTFIYAVITAPVILHLATHLHCPEALQNAVIAVYAIIPFAGLCNQILKLRKSLKS